ncbi:MAG: hypothetical protein P8X96_06980 [Desulfobacteraceae bacterium]
MARLLKSSWIMVTLVLGLAGITPAMTPPGIVHDLTVRLDPSRHRLAAVDRLSVQHVRAGRLVFTLAAHLAVSRVEVDGKAADFSFDKGRLVFSLPSSGETHSIRIDYSGVFDDEIPADPINADNPGFGVTGTIDPKGTMLLAGARWYPHSIQEGTSSYNITVNAPAGVMAVTAGRPLGHATENGRAISRWRVAAPLRGLPLVAGPYTIATRRFGNVVAATYFTEPLQHLSEDYLSAVGRYLKLYGELFGPYPFDQFAVVENAFPTGYGFPSFTLMGRRVLQLPFIIHTSLGHEIAHCWWGNGVLVDPSQGNWSEGLTTYVADYLYKERRGQGLAYRRQWLRNYASLVHSLRDIYARYRFRAITWSDFQDVFEARAEMDLALFFKQWVFRAGAPKLAFSPIRVTESQQGFEISGSVRQEPPYFDLPLDVALETDREGTVQRIEVTGAQTPFTFTSSGQPKKLTADPEVNVFRRLAPQEVPPTVNSIKGAASVNVVVSDDLGPSAIKLARRLAAAMGLSRARIGREATFDRKAMRDHDLLFVGLPVSKEGLPAGDDQFATTPDGFILKGETFNGDGASFFGVFRHPANEARMAALFIPGQLDLARSVSTKIPHYGKYSYLVFNETRNKVKGTWSIKDSPLSVQWLTDTRPDRRRQ